MKGEVKRLSTLSWGSVAKVRSLQSVKCSSARAKTSVTVEEVEDHRPDWRRDTGVGRGGGVGAGAWEATQRAC